MARRQRGQSEISDAGQDSFLDIVANIVGILIILVMVVAVRAKNAPVQLSIPSPEQQAAENELQQGKATELRLHSAVLETAAKIRETELSKRVRTIERNRLALMTSAAEKMIEQRREKLDTVGRDAFDQRRHVSEAKAELGQLEKELELVSSTKPEPVRVESLPTPLSRTVHGKELHLQLRAGRVTVLPWDEMIEALKNEFQRQAHRIQRDSELTGNIGPIGGFRVKYIIRRQDVSMRTYEETGQGGTRIWLEKFTLLPVSTHLGETLDQAFAAGSDLNKELNQRRPGRSTVTVWFYPDSFGEYRQLRKELYRLGYETAGRPLPKGEFIGGSPHGSRSAAQ